MLQISGIGTEVEWLWGWNGYYGSGHIRDHDDDTQEETATDLGEQLQKSAFFTLYIAAHQALSVKERYQMTAAFELEKSGPAKSYSHPFLTSPILLAFSEIIARDSLLTSLIP